MADPYRPQVAVAFPPTSDEKSLQVLAILHYVCAGLIVLFSSFFLIYVAIGVHMMHSPGEWAPAPKGANAPAGAPDVAIFFVILGSVAVALGWTMAALTAVAGRSIAQRRRFVLCAIMDGLLCMWVPFGTALGVFGLILLTKPHVRAQFENANRAGAAPT
jgi:hypothetical protein